MMEIAKKFFETCESGKGWEGCAKYCNKEASFAAQNKALETIDTLEGYTDWMRTFLEQVSDTSSDIKGFATDESRGLVMVFGGLNGTPIGGSKEKRFSTDFVYAIEFEGGKIEHVTKIWHYT